MHAIHIYRKLLVLLLALMALPAFAQLARLPVQNFTPKEYGKDQTSDNWCAAQGHTGLIYIGNASGVLEYDGLKWRFIPVRFGAYVLSLAVDKAGKIFVGSQNEFGVVEPDASGKLYYSSLSDSLSEEDKFFSNIYKTYIVNNSVIFQSEEKIFIHENGRTRSIDPQTSFHTSFEVNGDYYVRQRETGLMKLKGDKLEQADDKMLFAELGIFAMLPYDNTGRILIATQEKGLYLFDPRAGSFDAFKTFDDALIISSGIYGGTKLSDGNYAFNTTGNGVIILDQKGGLVTIINKGMGLRVNDVKQVFQDNQQNLWLPLNNGIGKVTYDSPLSYYSDESEIKGNVNAVVLHNDILYVATSNGVYYRDSRQRQIRFVQVAGLSGQFWNFTIVRGQLVAGGNDGLFAISNDGAKKLLDVNAYAACYSAKKELMFIGNVNGIAVIDKSWKIVKEYNEENNIIRLLPDESSDSLAIWIATRNSGTLRAVVNDNYELNSRSFEAPGAVAGEHLLPYTLDGNIVFGSSLGLLQFDRKARKIVHTGQYKNVDLSQAVSFVHETGDKVWMITNNQPQYIDKNSGALHSESFRPVESGKVNTIFQEPSGISWIGTDDALIRFDPYAKTEYAVRMPVLLRQITMSRDSVIAYGNAARPAAPVKLSYGSNSITFEFALPYYKESARLLYSYRLIGADTAWSSWSGETKASFSNLHEGEYTFMVRAMNVYNMQSPVTEYKFSISPPWYRTLIAYMCYALLFVLLMIVVVKINSRRLRRENEKLEGIIEERTAEIVQKNIDLEARNKEISHQKKEITDSINYAQRIQHAILPDRSDIANAIPQCFILYRPKDIVSGDFYYFSGSPGNASEYANKPVIIAAADCTGHGVPGAFMSVVGSEKLSEAVRESFDPAEILQLLNKGIRASLKQSESEGSTRDGMDIALCAIHYNVDGAFIEYAAANRPLWIIGEGLARTALGANVAVTFHNDSFAEIKATKCAIGGYTPGDQLFDKHRIQLRAGDVFYIFSDGFADQFGGSNGKKLTTKRFRELLLSIWQKPVQEQEELLWKELQSWKGETEQIDDILVIGVRI